MNRNITRPCGHSQRHDCCKSAKRRFDEAQQTARDLGDEHDALRVLLEQESSSPVPTVALDLLRDQLRRVRIRWVAAIVARVTCLR